MRRFFVGGSPELEDPMYPQIPAMADEKVLSKYFFRTAASGSVTVKLHIMQQCQSFMEVTKKPRRTRTILDRLGCLSKGKKKNARCKRGASFGEVIKEILQSAQTVETRGRLQF